MLARIINGVRPGERRETELATLVSQRTLLGEALQSLLASPAFNRSDQIKRLLHYLVTSALSPEADESRFTEVAIGTEVFHRIDFDPRIDTIVRSQMLRLRKKLDEYYATVGASEPYRIVLEKNSYRPCLRPNNGASGSKRVWPMPLSRRPFWRGVLVGIAASTLAFVAALALLRPGHNSVRCEVCDHPLWLGFRSQEVTCGVGTMLFFRTNSGFERDFRVNFPRDLAIAPKVLWEWPASPLWDRWTTSSDVAAVARLTRVLGTMNSSLRVLPARELSSSAVLHRHVIVLGHPRAAPVLADLLAKEDFKVPELQPGEPPRGFINTKPRPGESLIYGSEDRSGIDAYDESTPDYALISSLRPTAGEEVLSIFGNRIQTNGFVLQELLEPDGLQVLNGPVFSHRSSQYRSLQIVVRVDYHHGVPTGIVYVTHHQRQ